jgi:hypothetical protein
MLVANDAASDSDAVKCARLAIFTTPQSGSNVQKNTRYVNIFALISVNLAQRALRFV